MIENAYDFRKKLLQVHKPIVINDKTFDNDDYFKLYNGINIYIEEDADSVIKTAAFDFVDFLDVSMNITAYIKKGVPECDKYVRIRLSKNAGVDLKDAACYRGFMIKTDSNSVEIYSYDSRGAAQALYFLEDCMVLEQYPIIKHGEIKLKPAFSPQMVHSGYGFDEYPNEYLAKIAHEGRDAILVYTTDINCTPSGYLNFNELIDRAARFGIDVYAYSVLESAVSPEAENAEEYYENSYGRLFKECPGLKGVTLVGESVEFPSRDPHISGGRYFQSPADGIIKGKPSSGMYPCEDYPIWLNLLKKIIRKHKKDADIVFWTYNWGSQPENARVKLIENLPTDITLQATFEMFEPRCFGSAISHCADYTLSFEGPGRYFESEAKAAKKRNIKLYSMTNTGGLTWDFGMIPYQPMPYQWLRRLNNMKKAKKDWRLSGIMECHHYGFYPSFISKLAKWSFWEPDFDIEQIFKKLLKSEFGETNYEEVNSALKLWSDAIRFYTPSDFDQYGAFRVGPACPFHLYRKGIIPSDKEKDVRSRMFGSEICVPNNGLGPDSRDTIASIRLPEELKSQENMFDLINQGIAKLRKAPSKNPELSSLINLGEYISKCIITGLNAKKWVIMKNKFFAETSYEALVKLLDNMEQLLIQEIENTKNTIPLVEADSRLGWEPRMLYAGNKNQLEWKIRQVQAVIDYEIAEYRKSLEL